MAVTRVLPDYRSWQRVAATIAGREYRIATKPGVLAHGGIDAASVLLAERTKIEPGERVVHLNCGNGLFGSVAASRGAQVVLTDRHVLGAEAARRTLADNGAPDTEVLLGHGAIPLPPDATASVVAIRIPHEKFALLQLLWDAFRLLEIGGRCYIAGATNEGVKTAARTLERLFGNANTLAHGGGHRLVVAIKRAAAPSSVEDFESPFLNPDAFREFDVTLRGRDYRLHSRPGVFSWDHLDEATAILAETIEIAPGASTLDLGCGAGALGLVAGTLSGTGAVCMVDADVEAVRSALRSAQAAGLTRARTMTSDVAGAVLGERFDVVVTNPPFHVGKATELTVPLQFIQDAWTVLAPGGGLFLVANRTLPYEGAIRQRFGNIAMLHDGPRFKVLGATR